MLRRRAALLALALLAACAADSLPPPPPAPPQEPTALPPPQQRPPRRFRAPPAGGAVPTWPLDPLRDPNPIRRTGGGAALPLDVELAWDAGDGVEVVVSARRLFAW